MLQGEGDTPHTFYTTPVKFVGPSGQEQGGTSPPE